MSPTIDVYYSIRSPYCYLLTPRLVALRAQRDVRVEIRPVYPMAVRDPEFFRRVDPLYRSYHLLDSKRVADSLELPYRRPVPDPIVQDLDTGEIAKEQPYIRRVTRLAMAAADAGRGLEFVSELMPMIWDGTTDDWHTGSHITRAIERARLDPNHLEDRVRREPEELDAAISANQVAQRASGHWGVPLMVFDDEPFYGQDRFSALVSALDRAGIGPRT